LHEGLEHEYPADQIDQGLASNPNSNQSLRQAGNTQLFQMASNLKTTVTKAQTVMQNQASDSSASNTM
jgi:hypothetical protein